jgi:hypothetical protein
MNCYSNNNTKYMLKISNELRNKKTEDIRIYRLDPANALVGSVLLVLFASFLVLYTVKNNMVLHTGHYLFFILVLILTVLLMTKKKIMEINRRERTISIRSNILFLKKSKTYLLNDFDSINIAHKAESVEEGYLNIVYSIVLSGTSASLEIISVNERAEAEKHLYELSAFLNLRTENTAA